MEEVCEWECEPSVIATSEIPYPENLQSILDKLLSFNIPESGAKFLLAPLEVELNRRKCSLVWKRQGATDNLLKSINDKLPVFSPSRQVR